MVAGVSGIRGWMAKAPARQAGRSTSPAMAAAARANGAKGGRPRKRRRLAYGQATSNSYERQEPMRIIGRSIITGSLYFRSHFNKSWAHVNMLGEYDFSDGKLRVLAATWKRSFSGFSALSDISPPILIRRTAPRCGNDRCCTLDWT